MGSGIGILKLVINSINNIWALECNPKIEMYRQFSLYQSTHGLAELIKGANNPSEQNQQPYESIREQAIHSTKHCSDENISEGGRKKIQGLPPSPYLQPGVLR